MKSQRRAKERKRERKRAKVIASSESDSIEVLSMFDPVNLCSFCLWHWFSCIAMTIWNAVWTWLNISLLAFCKTPKHYLTGVLVFALLPTVTAFPQEQDFPDISFKDFNLFILENFGSKVSLSTVLLVLLSLTNNPELLSLHAKHQLSSRLSISGWMNCLAYLLMDRLGETAQELLHKNESTKTMDQQDQARALAKKLDKFAKLLDLYPVNSSDQFLGKLKTISNAAIEPVHIIAPHTSECVTEGCNSNALSKETKRSQIPEVCLIKGTTVYEKAYVVAGKCLKCKTIYYADHEHTPADYKLLNEENTKATRFYINSAKYLKAGQNLWVDRIFSNSIINAMYSFHGSAAAYTEFWNNSFLKRHSGELEKLNRRQIWKAFIEESTRMLSDDIKKDLILEDNISVEEVTKRAFTELGEKGKISLASNHTCEECTQKHKNQADFLTEDDPAAIVGVDENRPVPVLNGDHAFQAYIEAQEAQETARRWIAENANSGTTNAENSSDYYCNMVVMDGLVMGTQHCAFDNCTDSLANTRGGVFCQHHELAYGDKCRIRDCENIKVSGTQACNDHKEQWQKYLQVHNQDHLAGVRRMIGRPGENSPWQTHSNRTAQPHDEEGPERLQSNYFTAAQYFCVETLCAPCGVVIAWTKFSKSESSTNILNFLNNVYPIKESRPSYVCIDKACVVLRTLVANPLYQDWLETTRLIVDVYHYQNHRKTDYMCRKWCNPSPLNGSAPNLVVVEYDKQGMPYYKRAFNTQVILTCSSFNTFTNLFLGL
jgi:hypothetical protein